MLASPAAGYAHADVKSGNVLLTEHGQAKLCDLAFARRLSPGAAGDASCAPGLDSLQLAGTFSWMAPESLLGAPPTAAADVYR